MLSHDHVGTLTALDYQVTGKATAVERGPDQQDTPEARQQASRTLLLDPTDLGSAFAPHISATSQLLLGPSQKDNSTGQHRSISTPSCWKIHTLQEALAGLLLGPGGPRQQQAHKQNSHHAAEQDSSGTHSAAGMARCPAGVSQLYERPGECPFTSGE